MEAPFSTGKTYALCISALQTIDADTKTCQALILTPTFYEARKILELTMGICQSMQIDCSASAGRRDVEDDVRALCDGQQLVVGTPGRVLELIQRHAIKVEGTRLLVLDGADELVARDFTDHIFAIHQRLSHGVQGAILSATMPDDVLEIAAKLLHNPLHIVVSRSGRPLHSIKQVYMVVEEDDWKLEIVSHFSDIFGVAQAVVFCNTRKTLEWLAEEFTIRGITTSAMHADMTAIDRASLLKDFRSSSTATLLATNMLARGIEAHFASLIINYDLPAKHEDYFDRTSSGSRFAKECSTVNLVTAAEVGKVRNIEHFYNTTIEEMPIPLTLQSELSA